jgi:hypothetical protein
MLLEGVVTCGRCRVTADTSTRLCQQLLHSEPRTSENGGGHKQDDEPVEGATKCKEGMWYQLLVRPDVSAGTRASTCPAAAVAAL